MATVGTVLTAPEAGWTRYDNLDLNISYIGTYTSASATNAYGGSYKYTVNNGDKIQFNFTGMSLRVISALSNIRSSNITIRIDGVNYLFTEYNATGLYSGLAFEKIGLLNGEHYAEIIVNESVMTELDALDVDSIGILKPYNPTVNKYAKIINTDTTIYPNVYADRDNVVNIIVKTPIEKSTITETISSVTQSVLEGGLLFETDYLDLVKYSNITSLVIK